MFTTHKTNCLLKEGSSKRSSTKLVFCEDEDEEPLIFACTQYLCLPVEVFKD